MNPTHLVLAFALCAAPSVAQTSAPNNRDLPQLFSATTESGLPGAVPSTPALRMHLAEVNLTALANTTRSGTLYPTIQLNLFQDVKLLATFERLDLAYGGGWVWSGSLQNDAEGSVTISVMDDAVSATINFQDQLYQVDYAGNGVHWVRHSDPSGFPDCGTNDTTGFSPASPCRVADKRRVPVGMTSMCWWFIPLLLKTQAVA